ncbi:MAG: long-chain fatty acid--CoA ligase [Deltaproteobacteria bacterium]|nr:long-chain fatty acid--CoA ligase [Deltaproteobacteria bacterium]
MTQNQWYEHPANLVDLFEETASRHAERNWIGAKTEAGTYRWIRYQAAAKRIDNLRAGLAGLGVSKGDAVGLIINNSIEWALIAFAAYGLGARLVPMYESELEKTWRFIVQDSGIKVLFVKDQKIYQQVAAYPGAIDSLQHVVLIRDDGELTLEGLEAQGRANPTPSIKPHWSEVASLIYTSGTSGNPKGVLLSHGNFTSNVRAAVEQYLTLGPQEVSFSILPWAHSYGQTSELYLITYLGASTAIMGSVDTLLEDIPLIRPTTLVAVPRVFNRIYAGIREKIDHAGTLKRKLFEIARKEARRARETGRKTISSIVLDRIVFAPIRQKFGGRLRHASTGSAAMNPEVLYFFYDIGIPIYEGYGLTETTPVVSTNSPLALKIGSVGRPIKDVTVTIDKSQLGDDSPDGEIVCFGPNVMLGYHNAPEKTKEVLVHDPELGTGVRTGDRGRLDSEGFLYITGRIKEEYKLENGKYVHPSAIEESIKLLACVANAMIFGDGKQYNVCLVAPNFGVVKKYAEQVGIDASDPEQLIKEERIINYIADEIRNHLKGSYGEYEIPKKYHLIAEDFTVENGMLTQTLKLKRREVFRRYGDALNRLYD